jgi:murein peptide amidase A
MRLPTRAQPAVRRCNRQPVPLLAVARIAIGTTAALTGAGCGHSAQPTARARTVPARSHQAPLRTVLTLGHSVRGRPIRAVVLGRLDAPHPVVVVGCIHGDETAGIAVADRLAARPPPTRSAIWIIPDLNPDGVAADTRQNAHRVDLNRNFPLHWRPLGRPGDQQYSGSRALSEPESRIAYALINRLQPRITIWFHQPQALTDQSGGNPRIEARFAALSGLPLMRLTRYPGSAAT